MQALLFQCRQTLVSLSPVGRRPSSTAAGLVPLIFMSPAEVCPHCCLFEREGVPYTELSSSEIHTLVCVHFRFALLQGEGFPVSQEGAVPKKPWPLESARLLLSSGLLGRVTLVPPV